MVAHLKMKNQLLFSSILVSTLLAGCAERTVLNETGLGSAGTSSNASPVAAERQVNVCLIKIENNELKQVEVKRPLSGNEPLKTSVEELLRGPSPDEVSQGFSSEIPKGTILLGITPVVSDPSSLDLNLSKRFLMGGGTDSIEARLDQLTRTVSQVAGDKKVYLNIEGKRLEIAGGEGIEVKQPIN
jgi:spore germination protein GerM